MSESGSACATASGAGASGAATTGRREWEAGGPKSRSTSALVLTPTWSSAMPDASMARPKRCVPSAQAPSRAAQSGASAIHRFGMGRILGPRLSAGTRAPRSRACRSRADSRTSRSRARRARAATRASLPGSSARRPSRAGLPRRARSSARRGAPRPSARAGSRPRSASRARRRAVEDRAAGAGSCGGRPAARSAARRAAPRPSGSRSPPRGRAAGCSRRAPRTGRSRSPRARRSASAPPPRGSRDRPTTRSGSAGAAGSRPARRASRGAPRAAPPEAAPARAARARRPPRAGRAGPRGGSSRVRLLAAAEQQGGRGEHEAREHADPDREADRAQRREGREREQAEAEAGRRGGEPDAEHRRLDPLRLAPGLHQEDRIVDAEAEHQEQAEDVEQAELDACQREPAERRTRRQYGREPRRERAAEAPVAQPQEREHGDEPRREDLAGAGAMAREELREEAMLIEEVDALEIGEACCERVRVPDALEEGEQRDAVVERHDEGRDHRAEWRRLELGQEQRPGRDALGRRREGGEGLGAEALPLEGGERAGSELGDALERREVALLELRGPEQGVERAEPLDLPRRARGLEPLGHRVVAPEGGLGVGPDRD